jgi:hypothetical protein
MAENDDQPPRLPPPPFWRTEHFALHVMGRSDRRWIDPIEIRRILAAPLRKERQKDGRMRYWGYVPRLNTYIRVVTLADGETVHTAFKDRNFLE